MNLYAHAEKPIIFFACVYSACNQRNHINIVVSYVFLPRQRLGLRKCPVQRASITQLVLCELQRSTI